MSLWSKLACFTALSSHGGPSSLPGPPWSQAREQARGSAPAPSPQSLTSPLPPYSRRTPALLGLLCQLDRAGLHLQKGTLIYFASFCITWLLGLQLDMQIYVKETRHANEPGLPLVLVTGRAASLAPLAQLFSPRPMDLSGRGPSPCCDASALLRAQARREVNLTARLERRKLKPCFPKEFPAVTC